MHALTFSNVLYCSALSTHGTATGGQRQTPPELGKANAPEGATDTQNHPPTEINKCSCAASLPAQLHPVEINEDQQNEKHRLFIQSLM